MEEEGYHLGHRIPVEWRRRCSDTKGLGMAGQLDLLSHLHGVAYSHALYFRGWAGGFHERNKYITDDVHKFDRYTHKHSRFHASRMSSRM
jgi:hypothetical protein